MPVPLRRFPVTDEGGEGFLRPVRGNDRHGYLVDPVAVVLRKTAVGIEAGDVSDRPVIRLQHDVRLFNKMSLPKFDISADMIRSRVLSCPERFGNFFYKTSRRKDALRI
jgi:hypothetical protein